MHFLTDFICFVLSLYLFGSFIAYTVITIAVRSTYDPTEERWGKRKIIGDAAVRLLYIIGIYVLSSPIIPWW